MKENVIISLADSNYFELLNELVDSIKRFKESDNTAICIMDAGLTDDQKSILASKVDEIKPADWDIEVPDFKIKGREWLKSQVSRAFLPKYFPNYKKYLWIDADAWVNSWEAIELYFKGCENNKLSIATSADRAYGRVLRAEWFFGSFARIKSQNYKHAKSSGFSEKIARQVALKPHLNIGVFALEANASSLESLAKKFKDCIKSRKNLGLRTNCYEYNNLS
jgi:lipopolysaccharide biosynthesis glycosyltransferase